MLVHRRVRRQGLGAALMRAAETTARDCGKTLLVLDAVTGGDAARLYERLGWQRVGDIPGYALFPEDGLCSTTVYYRASQSRSCVALQWFSRPWRRALALREPQP